MLLALISFWFMASSPCIATFLYTLSMTIDMVDGLESRLARQVTRLGGMMDTLTDMGSTVGLLATLATLYPSRALPPVGAAGVDGGEPRLPLAAPAHQPVAGPPHPQGQPCHIEPLVVEVLQVGLAAQVLAGVDARRRGIKE